ncbi:uncharacterized protein [Venturia canescens]|uniref:uncharacterized protein n=1 Tax=Venturia canescens TaxID=32260 RepID=UPI001C9BF3C6|nr:uncharacterized protein LOC122408887 [Venturia canescens]
MFEKSLLPLVGILIVWGTVITGARNGVENVDRVEESWAEDEDIREIDRAIRRHSEKENYPENLRMFVNFPKIYRFGKWRNEARIPPRKPETSSPPSIFSRSGGEIIDEEETKNKLPDRFSYVAREFYRYYSKQRVGNVNKKFGHKISLVPDAHSPFNFEDDHGSENFETTQSSGDTTPAVVWRNIINAPTSGCPKGQRKDRNGRCRKTLW